MKITEIIDRIESDLQEFQYNVEISNSFTELSDLYGIAPNGKTNSIFKSLLEKYNVSYTHWGKRKCKYIKSKITCPVCGIIFEVTIGKPKQQTTCSHSCSNTFYNRHTTSSRDKISKSLKKYFKNKPIVNRIRIKLPILHTKICKSCKTPFYTNDIHGRKTCSQECRIRLTSWKSRKIRSYPELFFENVLIKNKIPYTCELNCGKYFIDFAIHLADRKIALEVDGKQHLMEDRKQKDKEKDKYLSESGWLVYRINWKSINTDAGKKYIQNEIQKFVRFIKE